MSNTYYVAKLLVVGSKRQLRLQRARILLANPQFRGGAWEVVGDGLWHLCGWTLCETTAKQLASTLESVAADGHALPGHVALFTKWPVDVSAWPATRLSDAISDLHLPPKEFAPPIGLREGKRAH
uniref:hypothetical protein n=1 Tax=Xanthomonas sp. 0924 TaxID=2835534 RepID=UPI003F7D9456